jgi:hypothetical protein
MKEVVSSIICYTTQQLENKGTSFRAMAGSYLKLDETDYVW